MQTKRLFMKISSTINKPAPDARQAEERPAPYNWIVILLIVVVYLAVTFLV